MGSTDSFGKGNQCCRPRFILSGSSSTMQDIWVHESNWYYLILHMQNQESTPAVQAELQKRLIFDAPGDQRPSYRQRQAAKLTEIIRTCPVLDDESTSHFLLVLSPSINHVHTFESWIWVTMSLHQYRETTSFAHWPEQAQEGTCWRVLRMNRWTQTQEGLQANSD